VTDKSIRVKLAIMSLLEYKSNQQISPFYFCSFYSTRKVNVDESFGSSTFKPDTALDFLYHCNFAEILFASMCLDKKDRNYMMPFFCKWPSPGLNKQSWC